MAISVQNLLKEKKFPFIFAFFALLICATLFLYTNDTRFSYFSLSDLQRQSNPSSSPPEQPQPQLSNPSLAPPPLPSADSVIIINTGQGKRILDKSSAVFDHDADKIKKIKWVLCKGTVAVDYIPCLDNSKALKELTSRKHMEHRERHCPKPSPRCLPPLPDGYKPSIRWPKSRDMIWYNNVPHPKLVDYKKDQNWVQKEGDHFVFPGGGTQFKDGVTNYIDFIEKTLPIIQWGKRTRVVLDVGCGVASFGGYLLEKEVITMSFAPKDEHEAQIQFALERGIPAMLSVIGTRKLPYPNNAFDLIHCARCRVHWDGDGGKPLMELNRILRPGGFFVWSATPVYREDEKDQNVWKSMVIVTSAICWKEVAKTTDSTGIGLVIYQKPISTSCYENRQVHEPPLCDQNDMQSVPWNEPLSKCISRLPVDESNSLIGWPARWHDRIYSVPPSLSTQPNAIKTFQSDSKHWSTIVSDIYLNAPAINWTTVRNIMDMNAGYGGFAAALVDLPYWVMNVVPVDMENTLPIIFDRGLIGTYHDWAESFSTYPRTYDLLHSSFLFKHITPRCDMVDVVVEVDRIVRPGGYVVIQDTMEMIHKLTSIFSALRWSTTLYKSQYLICKKSFWRPS
ncbi:hypothetical protein JCGZ_01215 [Jatropha curcas]|uniref:Methyltransferase n=1 Tax=Jatropha curcas TaxID=180498 RepID=A0A067LJC3_JATCU|nr:probable methyltransferase PMT23 [Jatropha curcas]KDP44715.1 hypothetical protein JCGZ_01215 [Jatropha curcas]